MQIVFRVLGQPQKFDMSAEKNYTKYSFLVTLLVIVMMLGLSFVPPFTIGDLHFKRTNILSELITIGDDSLSSEEADNSADRHFIEEMERREAEQQEAEQRLAVDTMVPAQLSKPKEQSWTLAMDSSDSDELTPKIEPVIVNGDSIIPIEVYSDSTGISIEDFCRLLGEATAERNVRIAFLGDSYIEGDIITADVRERLQALYGGEGVGFVPFSSSLAMNRPTIKHNFSGWKNYSVAQKKDAPEELNDKFFVSGTLSLPEGSETWSEYEASGYRKHIANSRAARVIFENGRNSTVKLTVNDTIERSFTPDRGNLVQQIRVAGIPIRKMRVEILDSVDFIGYGVSFEGEKGIVVDNYSIRSNSGLGLFGTSATVNREIDKMLGYDLIVLQYGLNAMSADVINYSGYGQNMRRMVNYIKRCFPDAAVLMLGVGDRSTMIDGEFETMPAVAAMIDEQRSIAKDCGIAFWDIYTAMGGENSMVDFVEKGWAAKDYTHLSFGGGRYIAGRLVDALLYLKQLVDERDALERMIGTSEAPDSDSLAIDELTDDVYDLSASPEEMLEMEPILPDNIIIGDSSSGIVGTMGLPDSLSLPSVVGVLEEDPVIDKKSGIVISSDSTVSDSPALEDTLKKNKLLPKNPKRVK